MSLAMLVIRSLTGEEREALAPEKIVDNARHRTGVAKKTREMQGALTVASHFGFGAVAGLPYALVLSHRLHALPARGCLYGLGVWAFNYTGLLPALRLYDAPGREPKSRNPRLVIAHLVWGAALQWLEGRICSREGSRGPDDSHR
jgi:uncharacterized membrane protein YagU involved in acid resistance